MMLFALILTLFVSISSSVAGMELELPDGAKVQNLVNGEVVSPKTRNDKESDAEYRFDVPHIVLSPGRLPTLIVPLYGGDSKVKLEPPRVEQVETEVGQGLLDRNLSKVLESILEIQNHISKKELSDASKKLVALKQVYSRVRFLDFLEASILYLEGRKQQSKRTLQQALKHHPNYRPGIDFLRKLESP